MRRFSRLAPLWIALLSLAISAGLALVTPLPAPQFHDEFSYLLAGDTFARGRLTNPPHPLWEFFESFQILQRPTYASKYPPGQGLVLALGNVLSAEPILGVWLSTAAAGAALWWALAGLVPRRWAMIGALVAVTHPLVLGWNWSYWGGSVAMIGGAMVVGAVARWRRGATVPTGLALGIGFFILVISRPFEGMLVVILSTLLLGAPSPQLSPGGRGGRGAVLAMVLMLLGGSAWIAYENWRVTGSAVRLPYIVYENAYAVCPPFLWWPDGEAPKEYRHESMRRYYLEWELPQYRQQRHQPMRMKLWDFTRAYFGSPVLAIAVLAMLPFTRRDRLAMRALTVALVFTAIVFGNLWFFPHYAAPAAAVYLLIVVLGLRRLRAIRGGGWLVRGLIVLHLLAGVVFIARMDRTRGGWNFTRADLIEQARQEHRKLLVIVRPGPDYYAHNEWVYNDADIDSSPVVWARDRGDERNRALLEYFADREVLLLEIDAHAAQFIPYDP